MPGTLIALSTRRDVSLRHMLSELELALHRPQGEHIKLFPKWNDSLIERPRGQLATMVLEDPDYAEYDILLTLDDDIGFDWEDALKVIHAARETGDIVCAAYATRERNPFLALRALAGHPLEFYPSRESRLVEIMYATTGMMAVPRRILEAMCNHRFEDADGGHTVRRYERWGTNGMAYWGFYNQFDVVRPDGQVEHLSEDFAISDRARQLGFKVWCDVSVILQHEGPIPVYVHDIPSIGRGIMPTGDPLVDSLPFDLAAYTGGHHAVLAQSMYGARQAYIDSWHEWRAAHPDAPEGEWYATDEVGQIYLLELMRWHLEGGGTPFALAALCKDKHVLDYGCGISTFGLHAAAAGAASVLAVDVNAVTTEYAQFRASRHGFSQFHALTTNLDAQQPDRQTYPLGAEQFDVVHCWHVAEHVPNPIALVDEWKRLLKPGGLLLADWDFSKNGSTDHAADPMHHLLSEFEIDGDFADVIVASGFEPVEPHVWRKA